MKLLRAIYYRIFIPLKYKICYLYSIFIFKFHKVEYGANFTIAGKIYITNNGKIKLGDNVTINSGVWTNPIGGSPRTCLKTFSTGKIEIGSGTGISNSAIVSASKVSIGRNVMIGADCRIYDTDFHPIEAGYRSGDKRDDSKTKTSPIIIGDFAFIGAGSTILKGTHIGENSIIGAGSVVTGNIPANEIWAGNPAKKIKSLVLND